MFIHFSAKFLYFSGFAVDMQISYSFDKALTIFIITALGVSKYKEGFHWVKIVVSGGFNPQKIKLFEEENVPVDVYAVGSAFFEGKFDYTADIVLVDGKTCSKVGRKYNPNKRLETVE